MERGVSKDFLKISGNRKVHMKQTGFAIYKKDRMYWICVHSVYKYRKLVYLYSVS